MIEYTNLEIFYPWNNPPYNQSYLKIWNTPVDGKIPFKNNDISQALYSLDEIKSKLEMELFDRNLIMNTPDEDVERGIVFSAGTALGPNGPDSQDCSHVGAVGGSVTHLQNWFDDVAVSKAHYRLIAAPSIQMHALTDQS